MSTLRALGIIFLLYLGIKFLISGIQPSKYNLDVNGGLTGINAAFSLNIFNVKAMLLYLTVAPTFAGVEMINYFILSVIHIAIMAIWILLCSAILVIAKENFKIQTVSSIINIIGGAFLVFTSYNSALEYYNSQLKR
ncbi:MAG: homoserine/homoserine lactone efflux protein [Candidatus Endobugula sp.]|jgi:homoserine/homoserine lactone efflux protein